MKELLKRTTTSIIISSIAAFVIGLIMTMIPNISLQVIGIIVGIYVIVHGVTLIVLDFTSHNVYMPFYGIISGLLSIIVGIVLITMPNILSTIFAIALGIWIILSSVNIISISVTVRKKVSGWVWWLLLGIIDLICGFIILFNPFASSISIVMLGGIIIMVHSIITVIDMIMIRMRAKEITETIKANFEKTSK